MSWVKLDDQFPDHPKVARAGGDAAWLHICAIAYCSRHLTDGHVPESVIGRLSDRKKPLGLVGKLVDVGLWMPDGDGYQIHDYLAYNPSREQVTADRERRAKAGAMGAAARWHGKSHSESHPNPNGTASPPHDDRIDNVDAPVPSPTPNPLPIRAPAAREPFEDEFDTWYAGYPRKRAKPDALKAFRAKRRQGKTFAELTTARDNLVAQIDRDGTELEYVPYPASFLNSHLDDFAQIPAHSAPREKPQDQAGPRRCSKCGAGRFLPGSGWVQPCDCPGGRP